MPYKRRYRRKRQASYGGFSTASKALSIATAALTTAKLVKSLVNVEQKEKIVASSTTVSTSGSITPLNLIAQGDDKTERNGNSVKNSSFLCRMRAEMSPSATNTAVRIIFFWDQQANGATPTVGNVLQAANVMSSLNTNWGKRFRVVHDRTYDLSATGQSMSSHKFYTKLNTHTEYNDTTGVIAAVSTNTFNMLLISDEATNTPNVYYNTKLRFIDN